MIADPFFYWDVAGRGVGLAYMAKHNELMRPVSGAYRKTAAGDITGKIGEMRSILDNTVVPMFNFLFLIIVL